MNCHSNGNTAPEAGKELKMYQVIYGSPDNTDGIYQGENLIISARTLSRNGYQLERVLYYAQQTLVRLVDELSRPPHYR